MIAHVVDREDDRQFLQRVILRVARPQQHRHQARLPVMAVDHVRHPDALAEFDGRAAKLRKTLGVVRIILPRHAVQLLAVEIFRIIHKVIVDAVQRSALHDSREAQRRRPSEP